MPSRPAMAIRWTTALVEPPIAISTVMAFSSACRVMMREGRRSSPTISTMRRPLSSAMARRRESGAGMLAQPGSVMPSASARLVMVEAVPITVQWPGAARDAAFDLRTILLRVRRPVRNRSKSLRPSVPEPRRWPLPLAAEHRTAGHHDGGDVGAGRAHQLRGRGLVAAAQQHHAVDAGWRGSIPPHPSP